MGALNLYDLDDKDTRQKLDLSGVVIIVYQIEPIDPHVFYTNVEAFDSQSGNSLWTIEKFEDEKEASRNGEFTSLGPFTHITQGDEYLIAFKSHGWKVAVSAKDGRIFKNIDLNTGNRPW